MRIALTLLTLVLAACAPVEHDITAEEAGPQAGSVALSSEPITEDSGDVDVAVKEEALLACSDTQYCSALKEVGRYYLNSTCGGGWSYPSGSCTASGWSASAPGGRYATFSRISNKQRYVAATQCSPFTVTCACNPNNTVWCQKSN